MRSWLLVFLLCFSTSIYTQPYLPSSFGPEIILNNAVLAKVNGKAISVVDVVKKLEMLFLQQYPEYEHSKEAKFEFFTNSWSYVLRDMIHAELILADAQQKKVEVNDGEVHQHLETVFGPHVIANLEKVHLSFEDAFKLVKRELTANKMLDMLQFKSMQKISPALLKEAYEKQYGQLKPSREYVYRIFTFEGEDTQLCQECLGLAKVYLNQDKQSVEQVIQKLKQAQRFKDKVNIQLSSTLNSPEEKLSTHYQKLLKPLQAKQVSDNFAPYRFIYLEELIVHTPPSFKEAEKDLHQVLFQEAIQQEHKKYLDHLKENFSLSDEELLQLPENFQPFAFK